MIINLYIFLNYIILKNNINIIILLNIFNILKYKF